MGEPATTASDRNFVGGELNRNRADAAVTQPRQLRLRMKAQTAAVFRLWGRFYMAKAEQARFWLQPNRAQVSAFGLYFPSRKCPQPCPCPVQSKSARALFVAEGPNMPKVPVLGVISHKGNVRSIRSPCFQPKPVQGGTLAAGQGTQQLPVLGGDFPSGKCPQLEIGSRRPAIPAEASDSDGIGPESGNGVRPVP